MDNFLHYLDMPKVVDQAIFDVIDCTQLLVRTLPMQVICTYITRF